MDQLKKLLAGLSLGQKISIAAVALLSAALLYGLTHWRYENDFRPLYTSMAPEDAAGVVQKLRETGVEYRLAENGGEVLVPSAKLAESRLTLAAAGLPKSGRIGFELFDKSTFGATDFVEHINYKRALEGELERSVMSIGEIEQARVHLTLPKDSVFVEQQQPAKASVMVKLRPGGEISQQNVAAIANLVASAVEGLGPEAVAVVDMSGNLLSRPRRSNPADGSEATSEALEFRHQIEHDLVSKIHGTLDPLLGADRFRAGASVDCDLSSGEQQEETFDPTRSVMASSQKTEDMVERGSNGSGIPGTASNLPRGNSSGTTTSGGGTSRRTESVTFQTSRTIRHTRIPQGMIKRMSLAVLVDQTARWEGEGAARHRVLEPPKPEMLQSLKGLIAAATGLNTERGDQLIIESLPFESTVNAPPPSAAPAKPKAAPAPTGPAWQQFFNKYKDVAGAIGLVLSLLVVIGGGVMKFLRRKHQPAAPEAARELEAGTETGALPAIDFTSPAHIEEGSGIPERARHLAKQDAALAANVVRMWLQQEKS